MNYLVNSIKTLVLVDRNHNKFPVNTDFVGLTMSTTLKEHIEVYLNTKNEGVYLV
jgi:pyrimidine operon attenuation protein/uracil phosphoribosyltransferase